MSIYICIFIYIYISLSVSISFSLMFFLFVCVCRRTCNIYIYLKRYSYSDPFQQNPFQSTNPKHQITSDWISGKKAYQVQGEPGMLFCWPIHFFTALKWLNWLIHPAMISMPIDGSPLRPGEIRLSPRGLGMFGHHSDDCCDLMTCDGGACENHNGFVPCVLFYGDQSCAVWCSYA